MRHEDVVTTVAVATVVAVFLVGFVIGWLST